MTTNGQTTVDASQKPVIPLQPVEDFEVIEDDEKEGSQPRKVLPGDTEKAGSYDYNVDDEDDGAAPAADARTGQAPGSEQPAADAGSAADEPTARQRRRQRERASRDRERAELTQLRAENQQLRQHQQGVDARLNAVEVSGIDTRIAHLEGEIAKADRVIAAAITAQNGDDVVQAQRIRDSFRDQLTRLKLNKDAVAQGPSKRPAQGNAEGGPARSSGSPSLPPNVTQEQIRMATVFKQRHPWYDFNVKDRDSQLVQQLDNEMTASGWNPSTPEYWVELEKRMSEDLPHRFQQRAANEGAQGQGQGSGQGQGDGSQKASGGQGPNNSQSRGGPVRAAGGPKLPSGGGAGPGSGGAPVKFHISKERKQALVDLGVWGDKKAMAPYIKSFQKWDTEHAND